MLPALVASVASGQAPAPGSTPAEAGLVAAAEAQGARYARIAPPDEPGSNFRRPAMGTAERRCVEARDTTLTGMRAIRYAGPVRSGEFVIGGLGSAFGQNLTRKIWWAPLHFARSMPSLVVSGRKLGTPNDTVTFVSSQVAWPSTRDGTGSGEYFFPTGFTFPSTGRWLLVASSGSNWGCFILTVN
jgi:hypothetical protein